MAEGPLAARTELLVADTSRAQRAWTAHHYVQDVLASDGAGSWLVILALVFEGPPSGVFDEIAAEPLTELIRRHGQALVREVMPLMDEDSDAARRSSVTWLDDTHLAECSKARLARRLQDLGRPTPVH